MVASYVACSATCFSLVIFFCYFYAGFLSFPFFATFATFFSAIALAFFLVVWCLMQTLVVCGYMGDAGTPLASPLFP